MAKRVYREVTILQVDNGVIVREKRADTFGSTEWVFNDKKDLTDFINDNFVDAEEVAQMEDEKNKKAEHNEKA